MTKKVLKFGGTSVGSIERIIHAANIVKKEHAKGHELIVVVSAMSGTTNDLLNQSKSISNKFCFISNNNFSPIPIPNAFTPNGDGLNDSFKPFPSLVTDYKMSIFNKFGEKVFESFDINIGWDGYFKGKIVQDVYVYVIEFKLDDQLVKVNDKILLIK